MTKKDIAIQKLCFGMEQIKEEYSHLTIKEFLPRMGLEEPTTGQLLFPGIVTAEARIFYSQQGEDLEVYIDYFKDRSVSDGIYLEMGAGEGFALSNTLYFENNEGWRGVLVEPNPRVIPTLGRLRGENNMIFHAAVGNHTGQCKLNIDMDASHCTYVEGKLPSELQEVHVQANTDFVTDTVRLETLADLLSIADEAQGLPHVDVFFLDVEGSELAVLEGWDWHIPIYVMVIEMFESATDSETLAQYDKIREILRQQGYVFNRRHSSNEIWHLPTYRDGTPTLLRERDNKDD